MSFDLSRDNLLLITPFLGLSLSGRLSSMDGLREQLRGCRDLEPGPRIRFSPGTHIPNPLTAACIGTVSVSFNRAPPTAAMHEGSRLTFEVG